jgi:hypothetical protein
VLTCCSCCEDFGPDYMVRSRSGGARAIRKARWRTFLPYLRPGIKRHSDRLVTSKCDMTEVKITVTITAEMSATEFQKLRQQPLEAMLQHAVLDQKQLAVVMADKKAENKNDVVVVPKENESRGERLQSFADAKKKRTDEALAAFVKELKAFAEREKWDDDLNSMELHTALEDNVRTARTDCPRDLQAVYLLSQCARYGQGCAQNSELSFRRCKFAARHGHKAARDTLAQYYMDEFGCQRCYQLPAW